MASVVLGTVWLNVAADPSDHVRFPLMSGLSRETGMEGRVDRLAGGRLRSIKRAGKARTWTLTLPACDPGQKAWLEQHIGVLVCARDDRGHKVFGEFFAVPVDELSWDEAGDVAVTLHEVTFSEAV